MFAQIKSLFKSPAPAAPTKDQAWSESSIYGGADFPKYNPDDLLSRRGLGVYQRMMTDEQIKAVVRFKRDAITSRAWILECEHDELSDEERELRSEVFKYAIERMQGTFTDALNGIMSALYNGYSMTEKLYQPIEYAGKAWIGVKALKLRPCDTFFFHVDRHGNVERVKQQLNADEQDIDITRFIHYVQNPDYDEHYGRSELRECYRAWFSKDMIIKFQNIHLERFAAGFVWAQPKEGKTIAPGSQEETNLRSVMSNIQAKTSIILPSMMDLHVEHPATTDAFERAVAQQDKAIAKALLVPNLLGISEQGQHGSLAQADTQLEAFLWTLEADASRLADALNEQLFRELGDLNFGDNLYPKFKFKPVSNKRQDELIRTWQTLVTAGAVTATDKDEEHLREIMEFPEKGTPINQPAPSATPAPEGQTLPEEQPEQEAPAEPATQLDETVVGKTGVTVSAFTRAMKRVDFAVIANKADNSAEDASQEIAALNSQAVARLVSLAEELKLGTADGNPNDIQKIQYTASEMASIKNAVATGLKEAWRIGESHARRELQKAQQQAFAFDPDQPRDEDGKWTDGGGGGGSDKASTYDEARQQYRSSKGMDTAVNEQLVQHAGVKITSEPHLRAGTIRAVAHVVADKSLAAEMKGIHVQVKELGDRHGTMRGNNLFMDSVSLQTEGAGFAATIIRHELEHKILSAKGVSSAAQEPRVRYTTAIWASMKYASMANSNPADAAGFKKAAIAQGAKFTAGFAVNDLALQDTAAAYLKQKAYTLAGDISNATQKTIRNILMEGVKTSKQPSDTRTAIYKALEADGLVSEEAVQEALGTTTVKSTKARISTAIRTVSFEAINEARYQFFSEPALDGFVEALEYSAILDDRTTEICSQLNGQTYAIDDEVWSTFRPPNHFNCRSILIPVTVRDTWQQSDQPNVLPQKGFGFNRCCNHGGVK